MLKEAIIVFLLINAVFWGFMPHSTHCQLVARLTDRPCPPHIVHLIFSVICFVMAIVLAQEEYVIEMANTVSNLWNTTTKVLQSAGKLVKHVYNSASKKYSNVEDFTNAVDKFVANPKALDKLLK